MKKLALLTLVLTVSGIANAFPAPDMTVGGSPLQVIQQTMMEENAYNNDHCCTADCFRCGGFRS